MSNVAIMELNDRRGSSIHGIEKHIASRYDVDAYPKTAISSRTIVRIKGASGSFRLSAIKRSTSRRIRRIKVPIMKKAKKSVEKEPTAPERKPGSRKPGFAKRFDKKSAATWGYLPGEIC